MSAYVLTDFEINLLLHLALHGPREAVDWKPMTDVPAELGARLAARNAAAAGRPGDGARGYVFAPLDVEVSAVEGLKQIDHYLYQTKDEDGAWRRGGVESFIDTLRSRLVSSLPGWEEAPWRWTLQDALEHESSRVDDEPEVDPRVSELLQWFDRAGASLVPSNPAMPVVGISDPRSVLGSWHFPLRYRGLPPLQVVLLSHDAIAAHHFLRLRADADRVHPTLHVGLFRFGAAVVSIKYHTPGGVPEADVWALVDRLGRPDQRWASIDPPVFAGRAEVMARNVRIGFTSYRESTSVIAHDHQSLGLLAESILDDDTRVQVEAVDPRSQTILLITNIPDLGDITGVAMRETVSMGTYDPARPAYNIEMSVRPPSDGIGCLVVMDHLPHVPTALELRDPKKGLVGGVSVHQPPSGAEDEDQY